MVSGKHILIAPLDWGHGHATRCVPLIRQLSTHNKILIGTTQANYQFFQQQFPNIPTIQLPAYQIHYHRFLPVWFKILTDWWRIQKVIHSENTLLPSIIKEHQIDYIISDNRFGLHSKHCHCVFVTNQLFLKTPFLNALAQSINRKYIMQFDEVWVPDYGDEKLSLSGSLNHGKQFHPQVKFIGPLSRLQKIENPTITCDVLVLLSGPEPQHTIFFAQMKKWADMNKQLQFVFVSTVIKIPVEENVRAFYQPDESLLSNIISGSRLVICRSGYSSLMDLHCLGKQQIYLCATPGQTEQIYLAKYWQKKFGATMINPGKPQLITF